MKIRLHLLLFAALPLGCADSPSGNGLPASQPAQIEGFWFSGAELNRYELTQSRYGAEHPGHAEFIFVTEPFDLKDQVKSDTGGAGTAPVLKLNALRTFNTGLYSYRTMVSVFTPTAPLDAPHALKATLSVQDWCGQVFSQLNRKGGEWRLQSFSYFQSEGDVIRDINADGAWLEENLFVAARLNPAALPAGKFRAMPSQLFFRFAHQPPQVYDATGMLDSSGGSTVYTLHYPQLDRRVTITFDTAFPHVIRAWTERNLRTGQETAARLTHRQMNVNYWRHNHPADRAMRQELGLEPIPN